jgi:hypothetical protein
MQAVGQARKGDTVFPSHLAIESQFVRSVCGAGGLLRCLKDGKPGPGGRKGLVRIRVEVGVHSKICSTFAQRCWLFCRLVPPEFIPVGHARLHLNEAMHGRPSHKEVAKS